MSQTKKILVIEDEFLLRQDMMAMLKFEGFEVIGAENGIIGIEQARIHLPDLIICDIMMPGADGYDVLTTLRSEAQTAAIPFIFLTARTHHDDRRQGMGSGADDYLTKPFAVPELLATIRTRLDRAETLRREGERLAEQRSQDLRNNIILSMPHELRTPLTVVLGFSDMLISDHQEMERGRIGEMAQHIHNAGQRLYRLVENYLVYAQIEIVMTDPEYRTLFRNSETPDPWVIAEHLSLQTAQKYQREGDLELEIGRLTSLPMLEEYFRKLIEELVDNAFKFSEAGQRVTVTLSHEDSLYRLCVTDHGRGMTEDQIRMIGAYMQFNRQMYEQQGSGLGLVIARRIAELHGGQFAINSEVNQHTTITVTIPDDATL